MKKKKCVDRGGWVVAVVIAMLAASAGTSGASRRPDQASAGKTAVTLDN